jgi:hypothetical protein
MGHAISNSSGSGATPIYKMDDIDGSITKFIETKWDTLWTKILKNSQ